MILRNMHKLAARYLMLGMKPTVIAAQLPGVTATQIKRWRLDLDFKKYMFQLEEKYLTLLDKDLDHQRRSATARLQEVLEIPYDSKKFNMDDLKWAVTLVFQIDERKHKVERISMDISHRDGRVAETQEQKAALKELMMKTGDPSRYGYTSMGEA